jgi:hypothetical protein
MSGMPTIVVSYFENVPNGTATEVVKTLLGKETYEGIGESLLPHIPSVDKPGRSQEPTATLG